MRNAPSSRSPRSARLAAAATTILALAACADHPTAPSAADVPVEPPAAVGSADLARSLGGALATASTGVVVVGCDSVAVTLSTTEATLVSLMNTQRSAVGLAPFCVHPALMTAARAHSEDMAAHNFLSHYSWSGESFMTRALRAGYTFTYLGENLGVGSSSPSVIVARWMGDEGQRRNILSSQFREVGVGRGYSATSLYKYYYTGMFGSR